MQVWSRRGIDLINVLTNACGILFQTKLTDFGDKETVVPFHPRRAQYMKDRVKRLATVTHQHSAVSGSDVNHAQHVVQRCPAGM
jgi:hypothetical protein